MVCDGSTGPLFRPQEFETFPDWGASSLDSFFRLERPANGGTIPDASRTPMRGPVGVAMRNRRRRPCWRSAEYRVVLHCST